MNIKDHGTWQRYTPEKRPENAPAGALFVRRASDRVDWYDYVNSGKNFKPETVKLTVLNDIVGTAVTDATAMWPDNATVLEISDAPKGDPMKQFANKTYDAASKTLSDPPPPLASPLDEILQRLKALENKDGSP